MPPSSTSSFIPKHTPGTKPKVVRRYNLFVLPVLSYSLFVAAPLASAALFIYQIRTQTQFNNAVLNLEEQIETFNESDLARVVEFDTRLRLAQGLVNSHVSLVSLFTILESVTVETVQFKNLTIKRENEATVSVTATLNTSAFDGALFQRRVYATSPAITSATLSDVTLLKTLVTDSEGSTTEVIDDKLTIKAEFAFAADKIMYSPVATTLSSDTVPFESEAMPRTDEATLATSTPIIPATNEPSL